MENILTVLIAASFKKKSFYYLLKIKRKKAALKTGFWSYANS